MQPLASPVLAFKSDPPSLDKAIARPDLVARLRGIATPAKWLVAPSGSGKSTLAADYARAAGKPLLWYRLDERDDDPAFFYAGFAAMFTSVQGNHAPLLPAFAQDDHANPGAFATRFVATLAGRCGDGVTVVVDDVHRVGGPATMQALAALARIASATLDLVFVSEQTPPAAFFDLIATRDLALCNDIALEFDAGQCAALAALARLPMPDGPALRSLTGGHAAALVIACELLRGTGPEPRRSNAVGDQIHRHLLSRLLDRMAEPRVRLLLCTGLAPHFTAAMASELAGDDAAAALEDLVGQGLLRRTAGDPAVYEAHGLVQRGVRAELRARLGERGAEALAERTAAVLEAHGLDEQALVAWTGCCNFTAATRVLMRLAPRYAAHGQVELLLRALAALPAEMVDAAPRLAYWAGRALLGIDEQGARGWFERCHASFERAGDVAGMRLAAASVITAYGLEYGDLRGLDGWMERHSNAGGDTPIVAGAADEGALCLGAVCAAIVRGSYPDAIDAVALADRVRVLLDDPRAWLTPDEPIAAARLLVDHCRIFRSCEEAQAMVVNTRNVAGRAGGGALQRGRWCITAALAYSDDGAFDSAAANLSDAATMLEDTGSARLGFELGMAHVDLAHKRSDLDQAASRLKQLEALATHAPPAQRAEHARLTARTLLLQGRHAEGLRWSDEALRSATLAGFSGSHARLFEVERIYALAANERFDDAIGVADGMLKGLADHQRRGVEIIGDALRFLATEDVVALARAMRNGEATGFVNLLSRARPQVARICQAALARELHADFARRIIAVQSLPAPPSAGPEWPWPVRIRTFGGFELDLRGKRYRPAHKTQEKPLELLKLLVTCQALGRDSADRQWLAERLWPDADEPNARKSLDMTLSRLRKLLRDDEAVLLSEGRLMLSPERVWTDLTPLLRALRRAGNERDRHASGASALADEAIAEVTAVLAHYRGPYLPEESEAPWLLAGREAVRSMVRSALFIAAKILAGRDDERLIAALERALLADPTSEDLARALMLALARQGRYAEGVRVYRRLREMLSIVLGLAPSAETDRIRTELYANVPAGGTGVQPVPDARGRPRPQPTEK